MHLKNFENIFLLELVNMNYQNLFNLLNLVKRLFILRYLKKSSFLFVCKHAWVVFWQWSTHQTTNTHVLPVRWQTLPPPPMPTDSCRKMFLVMLSERMCTPSTHTIAFPKRQFPPKRGRENSQRKQHYFLPFFLSFGEGK